MQVCGGLMLGLACRSYRLRHVLIILRSSFYPGPNDLPTPPTVRVPVSSERLHPEDQQKQSQLSARRADSHCPSSPARHGGGTSDLEANAEEFQTAPNSGDAQRR